ncbi:hypothetical protein KEM52_003855 [Ascosphaera acerosa]|nr:hypothetical protein KEM52_003855 [Ascosphaera acerosa]
MLLIGLTGSIATGKSTVSSILSSPPYCLPVIDADILARKVVEPGTPGYNAIVAHFGPKTPDLLLPDDVPNTYTAGHGRPLNRPALGRCVFGSSEQACRDRAVLNGIVHPAVRRAMYRELLHCYLRGHWAVVLDVPLLFESAIDLICGTVLVVAVRDRQTQIQRLLARDTHLTADDAGKRVESQGDVLEKAARADHRGGAGGAARARALVVWNDEGREELEGRVREAMRTVRATSPDWWAWVLLACPPLAACVAGWNYWLNQRERQQWLQEKEREKARL